MANFGDFALAGLNYISGGQASMRGQVGAIQAQEAATLNAQKGIEAQTQAQREALALYQKELDRQRTLLEPFRYGGTDAYLNYLYRISGRMPSEDQIRSLYAEGATGSNAKIANLRAKIDEIKALEKEGTSVTKARPGGGWLNPKVHTWTETVGARTLTDAEKASIAAYEEGIKQEEAALEAKVKQAATGGWQPWVMAESPTYKIQKEEAERATQRALIGSGLQGSGYAPVVQADVARKMAAEEEARQLGYLTGLAQSGQEAAAGMSGAGLTMASQMGNMYGQGAQTTANIYGQLGQSAQQNIYAGAGAKAAQTSWLADLGNAYLKNRASNSVYGGGGRPSTPTTTAKSSWEDWYPTSLVPDYAPSKKTSGVSRSPRALIS